MRVYLGTDHRGFELKERVRVWLEEEGYEVVDVGAYELDPDDDYPDFAVKVAKGVAGNGDARGILLCGSGHGVDIVANRFKEVRSIVGFNQDVVVQGREHEDANVLSLPAEWITPGDAIEWVRLFLTTEFSGKAKYRQRIVRLGEVGD